MIPVWIGARLLLFVQFSAYFHMQDIILCLILISRLELWPETEEHANMSLMFSAASVFYYIQTATENDRFCGEKS